MCRDPDLKPESQAKSKKVLLKPTIQSPIKSPAQIPITVRTPVSRLRYDSGTCPTAPPITLLVRLVTTSPAKTGSPVVYTNYQLDLEEYHMNTPNQTPVRHTVSNQPNLSPAQLASRKLIQKLRSLKTVKHCYRLKTSDKIAPQTPQPVAPFPLRDQTLNTERSPIEIPLAKPPAQQAPKLPPQQALMPQSNPFDINSELIPFQEQEVEAIFKTPELDDFLLPPVLGDQITDTTLMHRHLPRQTDIDRIMEQINRKHLTKLQLSCSIRDMQAVYLNSPHFKDIYMAVGMNKMPSKARTARKLEPDLMNAVYMIHGGLLYRYIRNSTGDSEPVLCVPASKIDIFLELFHSSILGGQMGMSKCILTLQQKFYCPNLAYHVRMYIISCHVCQTFKNHKRFDRPMNRRIIDINAPTLTHISMDIKHMPPSKDKFHYILVMLCEASNFMVAAPMKTTTAPEICNTIMDHFMGYFGTPTRIVCDQDPAFRSHLCQWFLHSYGIHVTTASPTNCQSLMAEHGIKSLANILMKHLTGLGDNWPSYCKPAMLSYNSYATPQSGTI